MAVVLQSIQVGLPRECGNPESDHPLDQPWVSGFYKLPVSGPVVISRTNLAGDGQADLVNHGGADKAICVYAADHYPHWQTELAMAEIPFGAFGENFSLLGLTEDDVCIGDRFQVGSVLVQVSQPRQPCWKLGRRWRMKEMPARVIQTNRTGWYFRVLQEGIVEPGQPVERIARTQPTWSITAANRVMYLLKTDRDINRELASVPELSASWRETCLRRAAGS
ncbi:MOSC domain-containing protein [Tuwongella immobilis]|uniref:MOSC domain-containing protein n=1 Tax=Tuwongella immobilis TaxID=692036 RepID=A0A6C2YY65_9BACT|nr:MOSC domain-containing protein [Tuwongella immobilis]VIP05722.1 mosc domain-containing protein : Uncharacterized protein OS=Leptolyngbya sp. PCC 7375 GN=Lepto7375DRAFT_7994 PE=4 SV=1: MOSC: 3-alpha [Tuwongella immobilis]VTS08800.1 mosc domain-containing protein : Uncharacterized protein OS=Leptolyngbya sp. PCC 7375 GN=Lepto7375DRAFT_7994 PE=4 SV=1: MOSC: 3-alpha [Tuwongella immobilis]